jgi:hypothetical protein
MCIRDTNQRGSPVFADMAAMASNDTAEIPVPADLSAAALRAVLAAIYSPDLDFGQLRSRLATITIADLFDINAFVKLYDLDKSCNGSVCQIILDEIQKAPHLVFAEASQRDDLAMAKRALSFFANKAKFKRDREDIEDCRYATFAVGYIGDGRNVTFSLKPRPSRA